MKKNKVALFIILLAFACVVYSSTGGNGEIRKEKGVISTMCQIAPWFCAVVMVGTGGNGEEPPEANK